jgi:hypothetical protein
MHVRVHQSVQPQARHAEAEQMQVRTGTAAIDLKHGVRQEWGLPDANSQANELLCRTGHSRRQMAGAWLNSTHTRGRAGPGQCKERGRALDEFQTADKQQRFRERTAVASPPNAGPRRRMGILRNSVRAVQDLFFLAGMPDKMEKTLQPQAVGLRASLSERRVAAFATRFPAALLHRNFNLRARLSLRTEFARTLQKIADFAPFAFGPPQAVLGRDSCQSPAENSPALLFLYRKGQSRFHFFYLDHKRGRLVPSFPLSSMPQESERMLREELKRITRQADFTGRLRWFSLKWLRTRRRLRRHLRRRRRAFA